MGSAFNPAATSFRPIDNNQVTPYPQSGSYNDDDCSYNDEVQNQNIQEDRHGGRGVQQDEQGPGTWGSGTFTGKVLVEYLGDESDHFVTHVRGVKYDYITCESPVKHVKPVLRVEEEQGRTGPDPARMGRPQR